MRDPYILWDWNGTLLDDTGAALATLNKMLVRRHRPQIGMDFYLDNFGFPVKPFYESIGVCLENEDWDALAREYHDIYAEEDKRLNAQAFEALEAVKARGVGQSVISALRQDLLEADMARNGVTKFFERICGSDNLDGASKLDRARVLLRTLSDTVPSGTHFVLIGDALHDKEVADALGIDCILCAQGSHAAWRLRAVAPTGETLVDALKLALE